MRNFSSVVKIKLLSSGKLLALGAFNQYGTTSVSPLVRLFPQAILAPSITTFSPSTGRQGDTITITGTNFIGTTSVQLGNMNVISFQVISATQIKAVIGSGSSGALTVRTTYGTATAAGFTFTGASSGGNGSSSSGSGSSSSGGNGNGTTPIQVFMPSITGISQNFGEFGSRIIIYGSRLDKTQSVRFGGVLARSFTINSENQITAVVGGGASGQITVQTSEGSASWYDFAYTQNVLPPAILSLNPTSITTGDGNYSLTLGGLNFAPSSLFTLTSPTSQNDITLQPTQVNSTQAIFTLPQTLRTVGSYRLSVANANSVVSTSYSISLGAKPLIHTISISSTVASSQPFTVSLLGDGFIREGSLITINNSLAKFSVISPLRAIVEIPREINTYGRESLQIRLTNYDGQSTTTSLRINGRVPPLITSVRPSWLNGGTTFHLIIEGSGFLINPRVTLGFQELQVVRSSPNQIEVLIPRSFLSNDAVVGTINLTVENFDLQRYSYLVSSNVFQQLTTSVQTDKTIDRVKIFPNPSADFINVIAPCSNYTTIIRNNVGAVVMTFDATTALGSAFRKELNVGALPTGAYSVEMLCGTGERFVARFVKF